MHTLFHVIIIHAYSCFFQLNIDHFFMHELISITMNQELPSTTDSYDSALMTEKLFS